MPERDVRVVPANEAAWDDLQEIFGSGAAAKCQCQRIKLATGVVRHAGRGAGLPAAPGD